jgi:hypothetical protein
LVLATTTGVVRDGTVSSRVGSSSHDFYLSKTLKNRMSKKRLRYEPVQNVIRALALVTLLTSSDKV